MRKRMKATAHWSSNGAAQPLRDRSYITLPSSYNKQLSTSCQSHRALKSANYHGRRSNNMSSPRASSLATFGQVLKPGAAVRRQFSVFMPLRGRGFDDVEDSFTQGSGISAMVRRRVYPSKQAEAAARQRREREAEIAARLALFVKRRQELVARVEKMAQKLALLIEDMRRFENQKQAHEDWMRRFEYVVSRTASFTDIENRLFEEFYALKYPSVIAIATYLDDMSALIDNYNADLSYHRKAFRQINLASRRIELDMRLAHFAASLGSIASSLSDTVVTPYARAKRNIDNVLNPLVKFHTTYINIQNTSIEAYYTCAAIAIQLRELAQMTRTRKRRRLYKRLMRRTNQIRIDITQLSHEYRNTKRILLWYTSLGESQVLNVAMNFKLPVANHIIEESSGVSVRSNNVHRYIPAYLSHWYLRRWDQNHPRSVNHDIAWKHLNVVHLFDTLYLQTRMFIRHVEILFLTLSQNSNHISSHEYLNHWVRKGNFLNIDFLSHLNSLKWYTWLRLRTESRVCSLGGVPDTISRGLFTPSKPLSSDLRRFFLYVDAVRDHLISSHNLSTTVLKMKRIRRGLPTKALSFQPKSRTKTTEISIRYVSSTTHKRVRSSVGTKALRSPVHQPKPKKKAMKIPKRVSRKQSKPSTSKPAALQTDSTSKNTASIVRGRVKGPKRREESEQRTFPWSIPLSKLSQTHGRGYCTASRVLSSQQPGTAEENIISNNNHHMDSTQSVESQTEDTTLTTVSGTQVSETISSHLSGDEPDEHPTSGFDRTGPRFWSYNQHKGPDGGNIIVHYCKTLGSAERVAKLFSGSEVIGLDIEWKAQALSTSGIKSNVSLIQIANAERIALFHLAVFRPGNEVHELVPPSLKELLESASTMKVGVSIKADSSRIRRHLGIEISSQLELSHLYKLVKFSQTQPKMVNRKTVNLSQQVEELLGLPLRKDNDVRRSDWTRPLDYNQVQYAASDAYACICLYRILEAKRKALTPTPPMPAYAELGLPILLVDNNDDEGNKLANPHAHNEEARIEKPSSKTK